MALESQLVVRRGDFVLDATLKLGDGEVIALLGANGSGKSTLLSAIAGLLPVEAGTVSVNGRLLTSTDDRLSIPAHRRSVGMLGQDPLLFPHLTVLQNVAFGWRARGISPAVARSNARDWLDAVDLSGFDHRRPTALSGGQQQRAAIARAFAAEPDVLLLDEPMASLDVQSASLIRTLLRERLSKSTMTTVLVTHDVVDAIVLADRVAILHEGRIIDDGDKSLVLGQPVNRFAASLAGLNLLRGTVTAQGSVVVKDGRTFSWHGERPTAGDKVWVAFPQSAVTVRSPETAVPGVNSWAGSISVLEPAAGGIRIVLAGDSVIAEVSPLEVLTHRLGNGSPVSLHVDPTLVTVYAGRGVGSLQLPGA